jgi:hypothetical protein
MPRRNRKRHPRSIPTFESIEQEAGFWDSHSPPEYGGWESRRGARRFAVVREMKIYIEYRDFEQLESEALARNMNPIRLAEEIIEIYLHDEKPEYQ